MAWNQAEIDWLKKYNPHKLAMGYENRHSAEANKFNAQAQQAYKSGNALAGGMQTGTSNRAQIQQKVQGGLPSPEAGKQLPAGVNWVTLPDGRKIRDDTEFTGGIGPNLTYAQLMARGESFDKAGYHHSGGKTLGFYRDAENDPAWQWQLAKDQKFEWAEPPAQQQHAPRRFDSGPRREAPKFEVPKFNAPRPTVESVTAKPEGLETTIKTREGKPEKRRRRFLVKASEDSSYLTS